jgi:heat shock protein HslJ
MRWFLLPVLLAAGCATAAPPRATPPPAASGTGDEVRAVNFTCDGGAHGMIRFSNGVAEITDADGKITRLAQQPSGSGIRYAGDGQELRGKGVDLTWTTGGKPLACRADGIGEPDPSGLAGASWTLAAIRGPQDPAGGVTPPDPSRYELTFGPNGQLSMRLDCNRGAGHWSAQPAGPDHGTLKLTPMAVTSAACLGPSLDTRIGQDVERVRSYALAGDRLELTLEGDGGTYSWTRRGP